MKSKNLIKYFIIVLIIGAVFTACKKKETPPPVVPPPAANTDTQDASDNALAEGTFSDVNNIADQASGGSLSSYLAANNGSENKGINASASIYWNTGAPFTAPYKFTITFDPSYPCLDGRYRSGQIIVTGTGGGAYWGMTGNPSHTITFDQYHVNLYGITGTIIDTVYTITLSDTTLNINANLTITKYDIHQNPIGTFIWKANRTRSWHLESNIPTYKIWGTTTGTSSNGSSYTTAISYSDPLVITKGCPYIKSGVLSFTPFGKSARLIDFRYPKHYPEIGGCEDTASVTVDGHLAAIIAF